MTRFIHLIALLVTLTAGLVGCASTGDGVAAYTASLNGADLELVETHAPDGTVELELTYWDGAELEQQTFVMAPGAPAPQAAQDFFAGLDPELIEHLTPIAGELDPTLEVELVAPRVIEHQLENRALTQTCDPETVGFADCIAIFTATEGEQTLELVETRTEDGASVLAIRHFDGEAIRERVFELAAGAPTPTAIVDFFRTIDPELIEHLTPIAATTAAPEVELVGYRVIDAQLQNAALDNAADCNPELEGFTDCIR